MSDTSNRLQKCKVYRLDGYTSIAMKPQELGALPISRLLSSAKIFGPSDRISQAIGYLRNTGEYEAIVEEGDVTKVVTVRDMLDVQNLDSKLGALGVRVPRLNLNSLVSDAALLMFDHRLKSVPVYEEGRVSGKIRARTILGKMIDSELKVRISRIMTPNPVFIGSGETVSKARSEMIKRRIDQLPILKSGKLDGAISSSSIVFNLLPRLDRLVAGDSRPARLDVPVGNYSLDALTCEASDSVNETFRAMERMNSSFSIVFNLGEIQGIVTDRDFMRFFTRVENSPQAPMYIVGLPEEPFEAEATRVKFAQVVRYLSRGIQNISEARAIIRAGETKAAKKRYQVRVFITTPVRRLSYDAFGYSLPDIFDELATWAKRVAARSTQTVRRRRGSIRKLNPE